MSAAKLTARSILLFQKRLVRGIPVFRWVPQRVAKDSIEDLSAVSGLRVHVISSASTVCIVGIDALGYLLVSGHVGGQ